MTANDSDEDLGRLLPQAYDAPAPRAAFVEELGARLRRELRATQDAARTVPISRSWRWVVAVAAAVVLAAGLTALIMGRYGGAPDKPPALKPASSEPELIGTPEDKDRSSSNRAPETTIRAESPNHQGMILLDSKLPRAVFEGGTPKNIPPSPHLEPYKEGPRPTLLVPEGTRNLALGKPVKSSDMEPIIGELNLVTDGDKEGTDGSYVELGPGVQWVQIDLKETCAIYAILVWHFHGEARVYHDIVIQVADDPDFIENVRTVYNNDFDNSSGLGIGKDLEYIEDYRGRLIDAKGVRARYVRLYSKGNTSNDLNHYVEVEVHGKPAGAASAPASSGRSTTAPGQTRTASATPAAAPSPAPAEKQVPLNSPLPRPTFD